jgi:hypothetical protein
MWGFQVARRGLIGRLVLVAAATTIVSACGPKPAEVVVEKVRAADSPIVVKVHASLGSFLVGGPDVVGIYLTADATDAQVRDLWCGVAVPAGAVRLGAGNVFMEKGTEFTAGGGEIGGVTASAPPCDGFSPSPST